MTTPEDSYEPDEQQKNTGTNRMGIRRRDTLKLLWIAAMPGGVIGSHPDVAKATPDFETQELTASDSDAGDSFDDAVAVVGPPAFIAAFRDSENADSAGAAYVFTQDGDGSWTEAQNYETVHTEADLNNHGPTRGRIIRINATGNVHVADGSSWTNVTQGGVPMGGLNNVDYVSADTPMSTIQQRITDAKANGRSKVVIVGDEATWTETLRVPSNFVVEFQEGLVINVSSDHDMDTFRVGGAPWQAIVLNENPETGDTNVTVRGGEFDFSNIPNDGTNTNGVWLHNCTDSRMEDVYVHDVHLALDNGQNAVTMSDCTDCEMVDCEGRRPGYDGIKLAGYNDNIIVENCWGGERTGSGGGVQVSSMGASKYGTSSNITFKNCETDQQMIAHIRSGENIRFEDCKADHIHVIADYRDADGAKDCRSVHITDCEANHITFQAYDQATLSEVRISNCHLHQVGASGGFTPYVVGDSGSGGGVVRDVVIDGCIVDAGGTSDRFLNATVESGGVLDDLTIQNNSFYTSDGSGTFVRAYDGTDPMTDVTVRNNIINCSTMISSRVNGLRFYDNKIDEDDYVRLETGTDVTLSSVHSNSPMQLRAAAPGAPSTGDFYMDDGTNVTGANFGKMVYDGTAWQEIWSV
ncbi:Right handed beta helix region [Halogranum amylolyticum]|uniref:Right handed beta helix region n=1 Tax=Halogranum amylolyticum TaxID=660520 RepID=A0A1H8VH03_9EURY|nr:FG-GAP repeat protein [Halogranum amylolyticum]SEP14158.1 Right handed beta helix region [Halogranum amylolyticum]